MGVLITFPYKLIKTHINCLILKFNAMNINVNRCAPIVSLEFRYRNCDKTVSLDSLCDVYSPILTSSGTNNVILFPSDVPARALEAACISVGYDVNRFGCAVELIAMNPGAKASLFIDDNPASRLILR